MTGDEVRQVFLRFFEEKEHKITPSSSLIPHDDPTLLLTSAGMVPLKPYFLGQEVPPGPRLASVQKCFRTTDIEAVGDASHLTFFEMLGNFSVGNYFKEGAISLAFEFVSQCLGLPLERLWVTIFLDDNEAFDIWRRHGIPEERILRFGEEDNFWGPAGDSGPCGPCSEIHYDFGPEVGCGRPSCTPNCDCGRFTELWNLVFMQYNQDREGHRTPLPCPNIDTGMGLERATAVMQGQPSIYLTDLFTPLIELVSRLSGKKYGVDNGDDNCMRVVAEHGRGITFLIADGVLPANEGRGYVLRRLLRRAALFGRRLGLEKGFLVKIAEATIGEMGHVYPELVGRRDFILQLVGVEETRFEETLSNGLELLDSIIARSSSQVRSRITGKQAFKLYDTYGFPAELTQEIAGKQGFAVDMEGFELEMEKQRQKARNSHKFELARDMVAADELGLTETTFVGYSCENLKQKTVIQKILVKGKSAEFADERQDATMVLATTPFYAEMGGQVGDIGWVSSPGGSFKVTDTDYLAPGIIAHHGSVERGRLSVGENVEAEVDGENRLDIARNHTATHLLQLALRKLLGEHVQQRGSLVASDRLRFDFSQLVAMTEEEKDKVEQLVNQEIRHNLPVYDENVPYKQAVTEGAIALFDEKYGDTVRVLKIGRPPISVELCGGTHVVATGEIGLFKLTAESGIGGGLRRIEAVTGRWALEELKQRLSDLRDEAAGLQSELEKERKRCRNLERELASKEAGSLLDKVAVVRGVQVLAAVVSSSRLESLREMTDILREQLKSGIVVLGAIYQGKPVFITAVTPDLVKKGYHAGEIVKWVAAIAGGSGGGKATLAQGGGKNKNRLDEAIRQVKDLI